MKKQLEHCFEKEYNHHLPGVVGTNVPVHQDLHVDNKKVFEYKSASALVYHIPLSKDGLRIQIATLNDHDGKVTVDESMVDIQFGDV